MAAVAAAMAVEAAGEAQAHMNDPMHNQANDPMKEQTTNMKQWIEPAVRAAVQAGMVAGLLIVGGQADVAFAAPSSKAVAVPAQGSWPSGEGASQALLDAVGTGDPQALRQVLGRSYDLLRSGDAAAERAEREQFVQKYGQMHRLARQSDDTWVLYVGAENWPFPVPLVERNGGWRFDPDAGLREMLFRRIGENEYTAMDVCRALAAGGQPQLAEASTARLADPLDSFLEQVRMASRSGRSVRFHGYDFRTPKSGDGPIKAVAWPSEYRSSGVMTFVVDSSGTVYQKDLGPRTVQTARRLPATALDRGWVGAQ